MGLEHLPFSEAFMPNEVRMWELSPADREVILAEIKAQQADFDKAFTRRAKEVVPTMISFATELQERVPGVTYEQPSIKSIARRWQKVYHNQRNPRALDNVFRGKFTCEYATQAHSLLEAMQAIGPAHHYFVGYVGNRFKTHATSALASWH